MDQNFDNQNPTGDDNLNEPQPPQAPTPLNSESEQTPPPAAEPATPEQTPPPSEATGTGGMSNDEKMWGMLCHLAALVTYVGIPFGNILGPLILWLIKKDEMPFVDDQGKEAVNFQISMMIYAIASAVLICIGIGVFLLIAVGIFDLVMIIIASIQSNKGEKYRYPLNLRLIK